MKEPESICKLPRLRTVSLKKAAETVVFKKTKQKHNRVFKVVLVNFPDRVIHKKPLKNVDNFSLIQ